MRLTNRLLLLALLAVACAKRADHAPAADSPAAASVAPAGLAGTKWKLVKFTGGNDSTKIPVDLDKYNIAFGADGKVSVQADCNRGAGTWSSPEPSRLKFSALATTRAMCPPGSLSDKFLGDFQYMTSWIQRNGHLYISLMADAGIYEFEPAR
jgi:para-nitrobenzyl esterase